MYKYIYILIHVDVIFDCVKRAAQQLWGPYAKILSRVFFIFKY